jgi:hypothetical protein
LFNELHHSLPMMTVFLSSDAEPALLVAGSASAVRRTAKKGHRALFVVSSLDALLLLSAFALLPPSLRPCALDRAQPPVAPPSVTVATQSSPIPFEIKRLPIDEAIAVADAARQLSGGTDKLPLVLVDACSNFFCVAPAALSSLQVGFRVPTTSSAPSRFIDAASVFVDIDCVAGKYVSTAKVACPCPQSAAGVRAAYAGQQFALLPLSAPATATATATGIAPAEITPPAIQKPTKCFEVPVMVNATLEDGASSESLATYFAEADAIEQQSRPSVDSATYEQLRESFFRSLIQFLPPPPPQSPSAAKLAPCVPACPGNQVIVVTGATGSGKSSGIPAHLLLHRPDLRVLLIQPRRFAAENVANRIAHLVGDSAVGFRVELLFAGLSVTSPSSCVTVATAGSAFRLLTSGAHLSYDVVIVDEVHERNPDVELCLAVARSHVSTRRGMSLILMSASLSEPEISAYFTKKTPSFSPIFLHLPAPFRRYSVSVTSSPPPAGGWPTTLSTHHLQKYSPFLENLWNLIVDQTLQAVSRLEGHTQEDDCGRSVLVFLPGFAAIKTVEAALLRPHAGIGDFEVVVFHSSMSPTLARDLASSTQSPTGQAQPQAQARPRVILATNIAETSVTLTDVAVVIDSGLARRLESKLVQGSTTADLVDAKLETCVASCHECLQRRGRVGRVAPGAYVSTLPLTLNRPVTSPAQLGHGDFLHAVALLLRPNNGLNAVEILYSCLSQMPRAAIKAASASLRAAGVMSETDPDLSGALPSLTPLGRVLPSFPLATLSDARAAIVGAMAQAPVMTALLLAAASSIDCAVCPSFAEVPEMALAFSATDDHLGLPGKSFAGAALVFAFRRAFPLATPHCGLEEVTTAATAWCRLHSTSLHALCAVERLALALLSRLNELGLLVADLSHTESCVAAGLPDAQFPPDHISIFVSAIPAEATAWAARGVRLAPLVAGIVAACHQSAFLVLDSGAVQTVAARPLPRLTTFSATKPSPQTLARLGDCMPPAHNSLFFPAALSCVREAAIAAVTPVATTPRAHRAAFKLPQAIPRKWDIFPSGTLVIGASAFEPHSTSNSVSSALDAAAAGTFRLYPSLYALSAGPSVLAMRFAMSFGAQLAETAAETLLCRFSPRGPIFPIPFPTNASAHAAFDAIRTLGAAFDVWLQEDRKREAERQDILQPSAIVTLMSESVLAAFVTLFADRGSVSRIDAPFIVPSSEDETAFVSFITESDSY